VSLKLCIHYPLYCKGNGHPLIFSLITGTAILSISYVECMLKDEIVRIFNLYNISNLRTIDSKLHSRRVQLFSDSDLT